MKLLFAIVMVLGIQRSMAQETYHFIVSDDNTESTWESASTSKNILDINAETGVFKGVINGHVFSGKMEIGRTSSGFVKGFYLRASSGFVQRDVVQDAEFNEITYKLSKIERLYFYPDMLAQPSWDFLEMSFEEDLSKLVLVKKH